MKKPRGYRAVVPQIGVFRQYEEQKQANLFLTFGFFGKVRNNRGGGSLKC